MHCIWRVFGPADGWRGCSAYLLGRRAAESWVAASLRSRPFAMFNLLPEEVADRIMGFCCPEDAARLARTCPAVARLFKAGHADRCLKEVIRRQAAALGAGDPPERALLEGALEAVRRSQQANVPIPFRWASSSERLTWDDFDEELPGYRACFPDLYADADDDDVRDGLLEHHIDTEDPDSSPPLLCAWHGRIWGGSPPWFEEDAIMGRVVLETGAVVSSALPTPSDGSGSDEDEGLYASSLLHGRRLFTVRRGSAIV